MPVYNRKPFSACSRKWPSIAATFLIAVFEVKTSFCNLRGFAAGEKVMRGHNPLQAYGSTLESGKIQKLIFLYGSLKLDSEVTLTIGKLYTME